MTVSTRSALAEVLGNTLIVADGFSCREQIRQQTQRCAHHFAEVVAHHAEAP